MDKVRLYYPLNRFVGKSNFTGRSIKDKIGRKLGYWQLRLTEIQKEHNIDRTRKHSEIVFYKGDQWFSIPHDFVLYILKNKVKILRTYFLTNAPDEIFLPTLAMNSDFKHRIKNDCLRMIDWNRGNPYEFRYSDLEELRCTDKFFVRKVSFEKDPELINALSDMIHEQNDKE